MSDNSKKRYTWVFLTPIILGVAAYFAFNYWLSYHHHTATKAVPGSNSMEISIPALMVWVATFSIFFVAIAPTGFYLTDEGKLLTKQIGAKSTQGARVRFLILVALIIGYCVFF